MNKMRHYELTYLISPKLSEEEIKIFQDEMASLIKEMEGTLVKMSEVTKKRTGLEIEEGGHPYLATLIFQIQPEKLGVLEKKLKDAEKIIRYIILTQKVPGRNGLKEGVSRIRRRRTPQPDQIPQRKTEEAKRKVELKEIEKKLEEILGES